MYLVWLLSRAINTWIATKKDSVAAEEYRGLAERAIAAEEKLADAQENISRQLAEVRTVLSNVEHALSTVD